MFPSVTEFVFVVDDAERSVSLTRIFNRSTYRQQIQTLGKLFYRENWPSTVLFHAVGRDL